MTEKPDYCKATNAAYILLEAMYDRFSYIEIFVDLFRIIAAMPHVVIYSYSEAIEKYHWDPEILFSPSDSGFTLVEKSQSQIKSIIFYNDHDPRERIRFTIAHEIGHIVLGHLEKNKNFENEANCFARNLLCPIYAKDMLISDCCEEYHDVFGVSLDMASVTLPLRSSDYYYADQRRITKLSQALKNAYQPTPVNLPLFDN